MLALLDSLRRREPWGGRLAVWRTPDMSMLNTLSTRTFILAALAASALGACGDDAALPGSIDAKPSPDAPNPDAIA